MPFLTTKKKFTRFVCFAVNVKRKIITRIEITPAFNFPPRERGKTWRPDNQKRVC
jgi:hypothetical protein